VNEFSLLKDAPTFAGKHYTISDKSYIIHTLGCNLFEVVYSPHPLLTVALAIFNPLFQATGSGTKQVLLS
jgi:hypothetical protein